jgi:hypothetical protein
MRAATPSLLANVLLLWAGLLTIPQQAQATPPETGKQGRVLGDVLALPGMRQRLSRHPAAPNDPRITMPLPAAEKVFAWVDKNGGSKAAYSAGGARLLGSSAFGRYAVRYDPDRGIVRVAIQQPGMRSAIAYFFRRGQGSDIELIRSALLRNGLDDQERPQPTSRERARREAAAMIRFVGWRFTKGGKVATGGGDRGHHLIVMPARERQQKPGTGGRLTIYSSAEPTQGPVYRREYLVSGPDHDADLTLQREVRLEPGTSLHTLQKQLGDERP